MSSTMLKKIVLLLPLLLLITGCGSTYEIEFTQNNTIKDTISIFEDSDKVERFSKKDEEDFLNKLLDFERGYEHYKRELYTTEDITGYKYTYDFTYEEYDAMSQLRKCYEDLTLNVTDDKIELKTKGEFLCATYHNEMPYMEITIKSDYKIEDSNANTQNSNTATWKITKNNYKNTPIEITFDKNDVIEEEEKEFPIKNIIIIALFIIALIYILKNRKKYKQ
ncbi:MAG: hypothetical protein ACI4OP_03410 [Candidatus Coprovivens sp.]